MATRAQIQIRAQELAYWYLRLNGFLTMLNFVVHPDEGNRQETDVDVLGVRFPYRAENLLRPMRDDELFRHHRHKSFLVIVEVKSGRCGLNGPWTKPERQNILRVLRAVGAFPAEEAGLVAHSLHDSGHYDSQLYHASLLCIGRDQSLEVAERYPHVPQLLWPDLLNFIYHRFSEYRNQKVSHPQWDAGGHALWNAFSRSRDISQFGERIQVL